MKIVGRLFGLGGRGALRHHGAQESFGHSPWAALDMLCSWRDIVGLSLAFGLPDGFAMYIWPELKIFWKNI